MSADILSLANAATARLRAYDPGHDLPALREEYGARLVELGSNETSLGASPAVAAAISAALPEIYRYPDPKGGALKRALAAQLGLDSAHIALGNGSHELLMLIAQCFADAQTSVVYSQYGFAVFAIATAAAGATPVCVPALPADHAVAPLGHDLDAIAAAVRADTRLVYVANPNNPTGTWFDDAALDRFLARLPEHVVVVVDEAYAEYMTAPGAGSAVRLLRAGQGGHDNLIVTRTFSKAYALAGLRVGYAVGSTAAIAVLERLRESFNVNSLALVAAEAALADTAHARHIREFTAAEREWLAAQLRARGLRVFPSQTNFVLVDFGRDAREVEAQLFRHAVVVRPMAGYGLPTCLRISVGTRAENERLLEALA
ncbi:MAG: histidinol-phosphate transaminase [Lysobacterales bacterium 69-70]|nr:histidinol-phosphate transaminase [Xanthomonadaceae bacterium]ODU33427.1 MAG: histidinol-phosphate transaminase [Xanthomonadaceae bacterium SCN 69-320]ODV17771.1 MAG: histidinol-phosphate transaminase [Xanthomonadaceae bacterium SCN 69-25]OJZ00968.1 MAG: histidinol-phosphate transaminase [Xanthomonadales bacterium 69-70]